MISECKQAREANERLRDAQLIIKQQADTIEELLASDHADGQLPFGGLTFSKALKRSDKSERNREIEEYET